MSLIVALFFAMSAAVLAGVQPTDLLHDPTPEEWKSLEKYSGSLTRAEFEERLNDVFDPTGSLYPFLKITDQSVQVLSATNPATPVATVLFAPEPLSVKELLPLPNSSPVISSRDFSTVSSAPSPESESLREAFFSLFSSSPTPSPSPSGSAHPSQVAVAPGVVPSSAGKQPLGGLRVVIDPADIGGAWGSMEDRSTVYPGFGLIQEGDLNLLVSKILAAQLKLLGAQVFVIRDTAQPVCGLTVPEVEQVVPQVLAHRSYLLSKTFRSRTTNVRVSSPIYQRITAEVLLTKNMEARARAEKARQAMTPDITVVLQFDATSGRHLGSMPRINRNILFVSGAYTAGEIKSDPRERLKLLTKLFQNVSPLEIRAALGIARHLAELTGFPPVLYGNGRTTLSIAGNPYVVARNLLLSREHDGPVVVTEPYFMNQPETLQRLLAGDYDGTRLIAGKQRISIFREYAEAVASGLVDVYGNANK